jgi:hypothetical protein
LDAGDTTSFTISGTNIVSSWADKSGNGNNATATGTPTLSTGSGFGSSSPQTFSFNGTSWFQGNIGISTTTLTAFVVASYARVAPTGENPRILSLAAVGQTDYNSVSYCCLYQNESTTQVTSIRTKTGGGLAFGIIPNLGTSTSFVASSVYDGTSNIVYGNGTKGGSVDTTGTFAISRYCVGDAVNTGAEKPLRGNIGEIIVFSASLTTSQRQQVEGYLAWKWGLQSSLPSTHAYAKSPP